MLDFSEIFFISALNYTVTMRLQYFFCPLCKPPKIGILIVFIVKKLDCGTVFGGIAYLYVFPAFHIRQDIRYPVSALTAIRHGDKQNDRPFFLIDFRSHNFSFYTEIFGMSSVATNKFGNIDL